MTLNSLSNKTPAELRKFGWTMALAVGALGGYWWWSGSTVGVYLLGIAGAFLVAGLVYPSVLGPVEWAWMAFARGLGEVVSRVVLTVAYYLVVTPIGILARLMGHGIDKRPPADDRPDTYWEDVESDGMGEDIRKPY